MFSSGFNGISEEKADSSNGPFSTVLFSHETDAERGNGATDIIHRLHDISKRLV